MTSGVEKTDCRSTYVFATTKRLVILNAKRERIRDPLKRERIAALALLARNDKGSESRKVNYNDR